MEITVLEAGLPIREGRPWQWLGMRGGEFLLDVMESLKNREARNVRVIAAGGLGIAIKTSCTAEYVHTSDNELPRCGPRAMYIFRDSSEAVLEERG